MRKNITVYMNRIREQLWFRPLLFCLISIVVALAAKQADGTGLKELVPDIDSETIESLLDTLSASMLVISIFAVASMLSAFSAASSTASPRSFKIVVTDDNSQNALSIFIGSFIFSIVATIALNNGYYDKAGRFTLFLFTLLLFALVVITFLRWVDRISRLGRLEYTIHQVEAVAAKSLHYYIKYPNLQALPIKGEVLNAKLVKANSVGYVQHINLETLQSFAVEKDFKIRLNCIPGKYLNENSIIAFISADNDADMVKIIQQVNDSIIIGPTRLFDEDPRFGLIALTEIASRALSPGINDPGTAIQILGTHERLFFLWNETVTGEPEQTKIYDRVEVPEIPMEDFFEDAFRPIARDGANNIEVMLRLQKVFKALHTIKHSKIQDATLRHSREAFERAELAIEYKKDLEVLRSKTLFNNFPS
jgi:uncharacterized membrane protein